MIPVRPLRDGPRDRRDARVLDRAVKQRNKPMAALRIEAERDRSVDETERKAAFIAIAPRIVHADCFGYADGFHVAEPLQTVANDLRLCLELFRIRQMHHRAAAAFRERFAFWFDAIGRRLEDLNDLCNAVPFLDLNDVRSHGLSGQRERDEERNAFAPSDALPLARKRRDRKRQLLILLERIHRIHFSTTFSSPNSAFSDRISDSLGLTDQSFGAPFAIFLAVSYSTTGVLPWNAWIRRRTRFC